ncbi:hypothetical protein MMC28_005575 [Mycoblastus sanguinarius]|nr:hypothetical protein [Mycoblastus sanguinarius]
MQKRQPHTETATTPLQALTTPLQLLDLPRSCPGCGAFTQLVSPDQPGFYGTNRKSVKAFVARHGQAYDSERMGESDMFNSVLEAANTSLLSQLGLEGAPENAKGIYMFQQGHIVSDAELVQKQPYDPFMPLCNRCHGLTHHHAGVSVVHPTIRSIQDIISESPHKYNHIYHVLDAADFPLSLIPSLRRHLSLAPQRSMNRRAKTSHFRHGRKAEMSFIITRSDLLVPKKEQVDSLMPYIIKVLRDALGGSAENVRLGNVRCVSSKRGWWTKQVKEDIWNRGGGGWMVGKVNVGKSNLFENVFPKGRNEDLNFDSLRQKACQVLHNGSGEEVQRSCLVEEHDLSDGQSYETRKEEEDAQLLGDSLLPPAPAEIPYPVMPLVSSLPGTTASPIRLPFGNGKGELIDLPGLSRGALDQFVIDDHKLDLVMRHRVKPEQLVIKPGQSLLVGGLVRITALTPHVTILAYPFVPLKCHVTSTDRAILVHTQKEQSGVPTVARPGLGSRVQSAGIFSVKWDVTKQRAGPLTNPAAAGLSTKALPFVVLSVDVLIEGCGWVELVVQVRKKDIESRADSGDLFDDRPYPRIEIHSPDGRHVGIRQPMGAWLLSGAKSRSSSRKTISSRRSMKAMKKNVKIGNHAKQTQSS